MAMIEHNQKFDVPFVHLMQKIDKEMRTKLFQTIIKGYEDKYPAGKIILGYLNWDISVKYDYLFILKMNNTMNILFYLIDLVPFGARRSIPGFRYCVMNDLTNEFFEDGFAGCMPIPAEQFEKMITETLGLSLKKDDETYWKKAENIPALIDHLENFIKVYKPQINV